MIRHHRIPVGAFLLLAAAFLALQALALVLMGHPAICTCGTVKLWHGVVASPENSQQIADWYTPSHVLHGIGFYALLWLVAPRLSLAARFAIAIGLEAGWEIAENTPFIIDRYRQSALALGYVGDSVINSVFDTIAAATGFVLARFLPAWSTAALVIAAEVFVAYIIHDNLALNIIQLVHPSAAISQWQITP